MRLHRQREQLSMARLTQLRPSLPMRPQLPAQSAASSPSCSGQRSTSPAARALRLGADSHRSSVRLQDRAPRPVLWAWCSQVTHSVAVANRTRCPAWAALTPSPVDRWAMVRAAGRAGGRRQSPRSSWSPRPPSCADPQPGAVGVTGADLPVQDGDEVLLVRSARVAGLIPQPFRGLPDSG